MDVTLPPSLILLSRHDLAALMPFGAYVEAVADAFRMHAEGCSTLPPPMHIPANGGGFQIGKSFRMLGRWIVRANQRNALPDLNDHVLRDIGVSSIDAGRANPRVSHEGWRIPSAPPR